MSARALVLDAGGLIAIERADRKVALLLDEARRRRWPVLVPGAVMAQVWRDGTRQVRLVRFLALGEVQIVALDRAAAARIGELLRVSRTSDVVDGAVVVCAKERRGVVLTSDPDDLLALDPALELIRI